MLSKQGNLPDYLIKTSLRTPKTIKEWASYNQSNYYLTPHFSDEKIVNSPSHLLFPSHWFKNTAKGKAFKGKSKHKHVGVRARVTVRALA